MSIDDLLHLLEPLQQRIVRLIYLDGLSPGATAQVLAVDASPCPGPLPWPSDASRAR